MRGTKAKALRRYALHRIRHGVKFEIKRNNMAQALTAPIRYLYQMLKGRRTVYHYSYN